MSQKVSDNATLGAACVPDYTSFCIVCGNIPCVVVKEVDGTKTHLDMCGCCVWGEAKCLDPENW